MRVSEREGYGEREQLPKNDTVSHMLSYSDGRNCFGTGTR